MRSLESNCAPFLNRTPVDLIRRSSFYGAAAILGRDEALPLPESGTGCCSDALALPSPIGDAAGGRICSAACGAPSSSSTSVRCLSLLFIVYSRITADYFFRTLNMVTITE
jgi:hypothetical protein